MTDALSAAMKPKPPTLPCRSRIDRSTTAPYASHAETYTAPGPNAKLPDALTSARQIYSIPQAAYHSPFSPHMQAT